jgi:hypothetical protein
VEHLACKTVIFRRRPLGGERKQQDFQRKQHVIDSACFDLNSGVCMRRRYAITVGVLAVGATVGTGLAAHADTVNPSRNDDSQIVKLDNANVPNFTRRTVFCPTGQHVEGGGGEARGPGAVLVGSFPTDDGRGWIALGRQDGFSTVGISVFAICTRNSTSTNG